MGKLLDQVLAVHKSKMNADISEYGIKSNIERINKKILERAEKGDSQLIINFETVNDAIATAYSNSIYYYTVNELNSVKYIIKYLSEYYTNEEFEVGSSHFQMTIRWDSKLKELNIE